MSWLINLLKIVVTFIGMICRSSTEKKERLKKAKEILDEAEDVDDITRAFDRARNA